MTQLGILAIVAIIGVLLWRNFAPALLRQTPDRRPPPAARTLERDPKTGVYRPSDRD